MENKQLTVVVPTFNSSKYIKRTLECLNNQKFKNFNIIIIDDCSSDNTVDIIKSLSISPKITLVELDKNHGVSYCRNLGIKLSNTDYITFLDSDDWIDIMAYNECFLKSNEDNDIIIYGLTYDYIEYNIHEKKYIYRYELELTGDYSLKIYGHTINDEIKITPIVNNKIYNLSFLKTNNIKFNEKIRYQEDDIFTFQALLCAKKVKFIPNVCYHYCQNKNSIIHNVSETSINHFVKAYKSLMLYLKEKDFFNKYKDEFYLKFKGSLKGVINRTIKYCNDSNEMIHYLSLLYKSIMKNFDIEELLYYCDITKL